MPRKPASELDDPPAQRMGPDHAWFTGLYQAHHAAVVRYGRRRLGDLDAAAELAQEVFVVAWRRRREMPDRSLPWLYGVARRLLANEWRARRAIPELRPRIAADDLGQPDGEADAVVARVDLRAALARLSDADREVVLLAAWEGLGVAELATALDCSRTAAKVRLHRARRRLRSALADGRHVH